MSLNKMSVEEMNRFCANSMIDSLGITFTNVNDYELTAYMPVEINTKQPLGLLHGGANLTLCETLGSMASYILLNNEKEFPVNIEINANHIKSVESGKVYGKTIPIHIGKTTHIWEVKVVNENNELLCISRMTMSIIQKK